MLKPFFWLLFFSAVILAASARSHAMNTFQSSIQPISLSTQAKMQKYTWQPNCPVPLHDLVEVHLSYWGFDQQTHQGILIVHKKLASEVVDIFKVLYVQHFPIQRMEPMEVFKGDDNASMQANNTSAFNCRAVTGKPGVFSQHSYGSAIDINPLINPYVKGDVVLPAEGKAFVDRHQPSPGKIIRNSFVYEEFIKRGWDWGGDWSSLQDYQHFEKKDFSQKLVKS
jgi:hypothetical protein